MPKGENQKFKLYYLGKIMLSKTDETHYITVPQMIEYLAAYGVKAERKSIYTDLEDLGRIGIEIEGERDGRGYHYHVVGRAFEMPELKLLVDAIQSSKFITAKKSNQLIKKLEGFVSEYEAKQLQRQVYVSGRIKTMNESIYYNVDAIHNAITDNKKIRFQYFQWNEKKEEVLRHQGAFYEISPWGLCWDNENYYLIGYDSDARIIKHYRVEKMRSISMMDAERDGKDIVHTLDMATYTKKSFAMFGGEAVNVKLLVAHEMAGVIIDRFGKDVMMIPEDENHVVVNVEVQVSDQFIGWIFALGDGIRIIGPESVVAQARSFISRLRTQYEV